MFFIRTFSEYLLDFVLPTVLLH